MCASRTCKASAVTAMRQISARPDIRLFGSNVHIGPKASAGYVLGHLQGSLSGQILVRVSSDRIGGILSGLSPPVAALAGNAAAGCAAGNQLRGHRKRSIGGEPASHRLCRASVGRRGLAISRKPGAVGDRKRCSGAAAGLFVFGRQMAAPCGTARVATRAAGARDSGSGIGSCGDLKWRMRASGSCPARIFPGRG
jgi:hypothetical protein